MNTIPQTNKRGCWRAKEGSERGEWERGKANPFKQELWGGAYKWGMMMQGGGLVWSDG